MIHTTEIEPPVRRLGALGVLVVVTGLLAPSTVRGAQWPDRTGEVAYGDFDNDGNAELVVSSPESECGEGIVYVVDIAGGTVTSWTQDTPGVLGTAACDDFFGADLAVGDFDADGYDDLAVSAPGDDDSGTADAGVVNVLYGSAAGLTAMGDQMFHQDSTGLSDTAEADDDFGASLEAGDFDCDGYDDLAIGVPLESWTIQDAGGVHVLYGSSSGISTVEDWWRQGLAGVEGNNQTGDHFGASLAVGNFNGDTSSGHACEDLAIGIPDEDFTGAPDAGRVYAIYGAPAGLSASWDIVLHQDKTGVDDQGETGDRFSARLSAADVNGDGIDDLAVIVPGDGCVAGIGVGRHLFYGGSNGFVYANNELLCEEYTCVAFETNAYECRSWAPPVWGTSANEVFQLFVGDNVAWGGSGNDVFRGDHGDDVIFGGDGDDKFDGAAGRDVLIGGNGNDTFTIDADCEAVAGEVIDGGSGTDTIRSHLSLSELQAAGVTVISIENIVTISEQPAGVDHCLPVPYEEGPFNEPVVKLTWDDLPNADSVFKTRQGVLDLKVQNTADVGVKIEITSMLLVRGQEVEQTMSVNINTNESTTIALDLNDFIPAGVDPSAVDPTIPTSATIMTWGTITAGTQAFGRTLAPTVYGHIEDAPGGGSQAVLYREDALHSSYNHGDLVGRALPSGTLQRVEATGSLGIPGY